MVSEAVSELKGEPRPQPVDLSLDLPDAAHLPATYVEAEDVRLEAYRRLTAVRTEEQVDDVRTEWEDRFGPLPAPAAALLDVARLRVECLRLGITDLAVSVPRTGMGRSPNQRASVKLSPLTLAASSEIRLKRLAPGATYQPDQQRLLLLVAVPDPGAGYAAELVGLLRDLIPPAS
jgi:transcription-repair coupling factor (superfamily II helicase)